MGINSAIGKGALGTTAALILALTIFSVGVSRVATEMTGWIGLLIFGLLAIFGIKVLGSRVLGSFSFR